MIRKLPAPWLRWNDPALLGHFGHPRVLARALADEAARSKAEAPSQDAVRLWYARAAIPPAWRPAVVVAALRAGAAASTLFDRAA